MENDLQTELDPRPHQHLHGREPDKPSHNSAGLHPYQHSGPTAGGVSRKAPILICPWPIATLPLSPGYPYSPARGPSQYTWAYSRKLCPEQWKVTEAASAGLKKADV